MYKTYTIKEFRDNTRAILNEALQHPVTITRYDEAFVISSAGIVKQPEAKVNEPEANSFCANGHAIPAGRSKCMGKGCRYS